MSDNEREKAMASIEKPVLPPIPVMKNTGDDEKDAADYSVEKEKWISDVLDIYAKSEFGKYMNEDNTNKLRELLRKQNLEVLVQNGIIKTENLNQVK